MKENSYNEEVSKNLEQTISNIFEKVLGFKPEVKVTTFSDNKKTTTSKETNININEEDEKNDDTPVEEPSHFEHTYTSFNDLAKNFENIQAKEDLKKYLDSKQQTNNIINILKNYCDQKVFPIIGKTGLRDSLNKVVDASTSQLLKAGYSQEDIDKSVDLAAKILGIDLNKSEEEKEVKTNNTNLVRNSGNRASKVREILNQEFERVESEKKAKKETEDIATIQRVIEYKIDNGVFGSTSNNTTDWKAGISIIWDGLDVNGNMLPNFDSDLLVKAANKVASENGFTKADVIGKTIYLYLNDCF